MKKYMKEAGIQLFFEFIGTFMITFAMCNYYSMSLYPACEYSKTATTIREAFGAVAVGDFTTVSYSDVKEWKPLDST